MSQSRRKTTPPAILSYPHLFTPQEPFRNKNGEPQGDPKYGAVLVFDKSADLSELKEAVKIAGEEKFGSSFGKMLKAGKIRSPFRQDGEEKGYPEGSTYINAKSTDQPGVVDRYADPKTQRPRTITDPNEVYPGAIVKASVTAYGYDVNGNKGVAFALNNIQKWDEGDRLDSRIAAEDEFEAEAPAEADLSAMDDEVETSSEESAGDDLGAYM
jgi:hypothetical protein